jgi:hypothetical protein
MKKMAAYHRRDTAGWLGGLLFERQFIFIRYNRE